MAIWRAGNGRLHLRQAVDGLLYCTATFARYVYYQNLVVRRAGSDQILRWSDGLNAALVIPATRVIYVGRGDDVMLALDMDSWLPLGHIPAYSVYALDLAIHRLYAVEDAQLIVLRDDGGQPLPPFQAQRADKLPSIEGIYPSPDYDRDRTLWVVGGGRVFRSTDGGMSWVSLAGGLPFLRNPPLTFSLAVSPDYARDRTLYAGIEGYSIGYGIWRSSDGGDTWQPLWQGLDQRCVYGLAFSPNWPSDGTILAYARYRGILPFTQSGESLYRSTDRGAHWVLVASRASNSDAPPLPRPADLWPASAPAVQLARREGYGQVSRSRDGGRTWELVLALPEPSYIIGLLAVPDQPLLYYLSTQGALYRTRDAGDTWELADDPRLSDHGTWPDYWQQLAVAPRAAGAAWVFLGDQAGYLLTLRSDQLTWKPYRAPVSTRVPGAPPPVSTPDAPGTLRTPGALTPAPTPPPLATAVPTPCRAPFGPTFAARADRARAAVGCPGSDEEKGAWAIQPFERGLMFWQGALRTIYVLYEDGRWESWPDTWNDGQPVSDPALAAPTGRVQPVRGFGKLWRETLGGPNAAIGWALQGERGYQGASQVCMDGLLLADDAGGAYALHMNRWWQRP